MRSNLLGKCSAVAAVAVAGSANAAMVFDNLQVSQVAGNSASPSVAWGAPASFAGWERQVYGWGAGTRSAVIGGGSAALSSGPNNGNWVLQYQNVSGSALDMTGMSFSLSVSLANANLAGNSVQLYVYSGSSFQIMMTAYTGANAYSFDINSLPNGSVNRTAVTKLAFVVGYQNTLAGSSPSGTITNFTFVPAPGAVALLGAAGVIGMRRRKA